MKILFLCLFSIVFISEIQSQVKVYETFEDFEANFLVPKDNDTTYILNFWATWCIPCVKELPYFEALNSKYKKIKIRLVSLDFPKDINSQLIPFIQKKKLKNEVVLLADGKTHKWIDKIDTNWSGAIPITLFLNRTKKEFFEKDYTNIDELETDLLKFNNSQK